MENNRQDEIDITVNMIGDCENCGHSIVYHIPLIGCHKCDCDEFH